MSETLSRYFSLNRRYSRSINLERDVERMDALVGYIPTEKSVDALRQILRGLTDADGDRAWTITSVYGTGKSAFAQFLTSLCAPVEAPMRQEAERIAGEALGENWENPTPQVGFFRAVVVAQGEPISHTVIRALAKGADLFWQGRRKKPDVVARLVDLTTEIAAGNSIGTLDIPSLILEIAQAAKTGVFLVIDELGKNLEYAARHDGVDDLYLLQQLAELAKNKDASVYVLGLLHQEFSEYGQRLATVQRNEWTKIQGRFQVISFSSSVTQMMRLIGQAIARVEADAFNCAIHNRAEDWLEYLKEIDKELTVETLDKVYPLHPIAATVLPLLCSRYAQNDRSLFTFLTSSEPYSFRNYLEDTEATKQNLPTLKLDRIYDYFIEAVGTGLASRPNLQKWVEIQGLVGEARHLDLDSQRVLKVIGALNLVSTTGALRATRTLVALALCNEPGGDRTEHWEQVIDGLIAKGIVTHYRALNELRLWQGSDFNVDAEVSAQIEKERSSLAELLGRMYPLTPLVAQRHSYTTGTLRYFNRYYADEWKQVEGLPCDAKADGAIAYWLHETLPESVPATTRDGKPLILLCAGNLTALRTNALEFVALWKIQKEAAQLQADGVARREVEYRLGQAKRILDESLTQAFDLSRNVCWIAGTRKQLRSMTEFKACLSQVCDEVYAQSPKLWNELINRRDLTTQGAKARRELIEAMLAHGDKERLNLEGYGPEVAIYYSLLGQTGIHRQEDGVWGFYPPRQGSGIDSLWQAIEGFCLEAKETQQPLDQLYDRLAAPPYGVKQGAVPVILVAVLLYHMDDIGIYKDGTFIPVLGSEHFELLVKDPSRFSVKYFEMMGLRSEVFRELESILRSPDVTAPRNIRNTTLLVVTKPLFNFVRRLPKFTKETKRLSQGARAVLEALQTAKEPDELLFAMLPEACGLDPIQLDQMDDGGKTARALRQKLVQYLREIQTAYDSLLSECQSRLYQVFGVRNEEAKLREDLRVRASYLVGQCIEPVLKRFVFAVVDERLEDREWLEALVTIATDKPAKSWKDEDVTRFEVALSDLARRFKNMEALQKEVAARGHGFEAKRITVTESDGHEVHRVVWFDKEQADLVANLVEQALDFPDLKNDPRLQQAFVAKLSEKVLSNECKESQRDLLEIQRKRQNRSHEREIS